MLSEKTMSHRPEFKMCHNQIEWYKHEDCKLCKDRAWCEEQNSKISQGQAYQTLLDQRSSGEVVIRESDLKDMKKALRCLRKARRNTESGTAERKNYTHQIKDLKTKIATAERVPELTPRKKELIQKLVELNPRLAMINLTRKTEDSLEFSLLKLQGVVSDLEDYYKNYRKIEAPKVVVQEKTEVPEEVAKQPTVKKPNTTKIVLEQLLAGGTLSELIERIRKESPFPESQIKSYIYGMIKAVQQGKGPYGQYTVVEGTDQLKIAKRA